MQPLPANIRGGERQLGFAWLENFAHPGHSNFAAVLWAAICTARAPEYSRRGASAGAKMKRQSAPC